MGTAGGATTLFNAAATGTLAVGSVLIGTPTPAVPVVASVGNITWVLSGADTGQFQVYLSFVPVIAGALAQ